MARRERRKGPRARPKRDKGRGGARAGARRPGPARGAEAAARPREAATATRAGPALELVPARPGGARDAAGAAVGAARGAAAAARRGAAPASATGAAGSARTATPAARTGPALRAAAAAVVRQRAAPGRERSVALWNAFWTGDWFLVDHFDADARRFLLARRYGRSGRQRLSSRQWQVAVLVAGGYANKQIAHELGLAESTVATYLAQAMAKLGGRSRIELPKLLPLERLQGGAAGAAGRAAGRGRRRSPGGGGEASDERGPEPPSGLRAYRFVFKDEEYLVLSFPAAVAALPERLTEAERGVLRELLSGKSNAAIAETRGTSPRTVANQISSLYQKLGVASRTELAARFGAAL